MVSHSPASFAEAAAALKRRRAELAHQQTPKAAGSVSRHSQPAASRLTASQQLQSPATAHAQSNAQLALVQRETASAAVDNTQAAAYEDVVSTRGSGSKLPQQMHGVRTRSAARGGEHTAAAPAAAEPRAQADEHEDGPRMVPPAFTTGSQKQASAPLLS